MDQLMFGEHEEASNKRFFMGVICGFSLGAIAALLLAPRSGAEMRGRVVESANRASQRAKDTYDKASETWHGVASRAADAADTLASRAATLTARLNTKMSTEPPRPS